MAFVDPMDVKIVPTILTNDPAQFQNYLTTYPQIAKRIQIDIVDGTFVPTQTIQTNAITQLPPNIEVDLHMMVMRPSEHLQEIIRLKPSLCILHAESGENLLPIIAEIKKAGIKVGIALLQHTYPGNVKPYIQAVNHILIFAGALGKQGGTADMMQIEKVKLIRSINPSVEIGWDGGISDKNVRALAHADIEVLNVGSYISMSQDPTKAYQTLIEEKNKRGVLL